MAMKPEPMQRTVIVSSKAHQKAVIEALHGLRVAHLNAFTEDRAGPLADFRLGRPLEEAGRTSERLVKLRAFIRNLDIEAHSPKRTFTVPEIEQRLDAAIFDAGQEITNAAESRSRTTAEIERLTEEEQRLQPLRDLPLRLEDYSGYGSLAVFVGAVDSPVREDLNGVLTQFELFEGEGGLVALFVPEEKAATASDVLFRHGYREHPVPEGTGDVGERLENIARERQELTGRLTRAESALDALRERHADFLVAAEEHLTIQVAKAEAPLSFASTENAFVVDAWVPVTEIRKVEAALDKVTGGNVYVEKLPHTPHAMHGVDDIHGGEGRDDEHAHDDARDQPPTRLQNGAYPRQFQFFTEMFSVPKYDEINPTAVLAIAFPLFFGFMIADLGLGAVMAVLGFLMFKKLGHVEGLKGLGFAIGIAGVVAAVVGGFVFQDAFGMPFGLPEQEVEHFAHEDWVVTDAEHHAVLRDGAPVLTASGAEEFHGTAGEALTCEQFAEHVGEWPWLCTFGGGKEAAAIVTHPLMLKTQAISELLLISVGAAFVHLLTGLVFGVRNEWGHSVKHTVAKFGWMLLLVAFFPAVVVILAPDVWTSVTNGLPQSYAIMGAAGGLVVGGIVLGWSEGIIGVLEIPSMFSNILSYLRLGAVVIAKGAMAIAFNEMTLVRMGILGDNVAFIILGFLLFLVVQALLFVLGVLSGGIQAIRLNYVEFFTKFYKGGGEKFNPFGHVRRYSIPSQAPVVGGGKQ